MQSIDIANTMDIINKVAFSFQWRVDQSKHNKNKTTIISYPNEASKNNFMLYALDR